MDFNKGTMSDSAVITVLIRDFLVDVCKFLGEDVALLVSVRLPSAQLHKRVSDKLYVMDLMPSRSFDPIHQALTLREVHTTDRGNYSGGK